MKLMKGNMFSYLGRSDLLLVTGNSYVTKDGRLVMGRGAAQQLRDTFPGVDKKFGKMVPHLERYDVIMTMAGGYEVGVFQVKYHWRDPAQLELIENSAKTLSLLLQKRGGTCDLNFPGIGNGKLKREAVLPILEKYLSGVNVRVWEYGA